MQKMTVSRWACLAGVLLIFAYVPSTGVSTATESYEQLLEAVKSGRFSVDKDKDESKDVLQQILDKSKYKENVIKGTKSFVLKDKAHKVHSKLTNLKIGSANVYIILYHSISYYNIIFIISYLYHPLNFKLS